MNNEHTMFRTITALLFSIISVSAFHFFIPPGPSIMWPAMFFCCYKTIRYVFDSRPSNNITVISAVLSLMYSTMILLGYEARTNQALDIYVELAVSYISLFVLLTFVISAMIHYLCFHSFEAESTYTISYTKFFIITTFFILLCWLPYFVACYPGNVNSDAYGEMRIQAGISILSNHHPIIHQLMIQACIVLSSLLGGDYTIGTALYSATQCIISAMVFTGCCVFLLEHKVSIKLVTPAILFYAFFPINGFYSVTMYKNVPFAQAALLLCILLISVLEKRKSQPQTFLIAGTIITAFFFCTLRNNGYYAFIIGMVIIIIMNLKKWKELISILIVTVILVSGYNYVIFNIYGAKKSASGEMLSVPLQMFAYVLKNDSPDLNGSDYAIMSEVFSDINLVAEYYVPDNSDPIKDPSVFLSDVFDSNPGKYVKSWINIGLQHPKDYINAFLLHTFGYYDPNYNSACITVGIYTPNEFGLSQTTRFENLRNRLISIYTFLANKSVVSIFFSIGTLVMITFFAFALLFIKGYTTLASPITILMAMWLTSLAGPVCFYHYIYGMTVCAPLFISLALGLPLKRE